VTREKGTYARVEPTHVPIWYRTYKYYKYRYGVEERREEIRTSINYIIFHILFPILCCQRLVYPRRLDPMFSRDLAKLDRRFRRLFYFPTDQTQLVSGNNHYRSRKIKGTSTDSINSFVKASSFKNVYGYPASALNLLSISSKLLTMPSTSEFLANTMNVAFAFLVCPDPLP
jgi:hypothetical protein